MSLTKGQSGEHTDWRDGFLFIANHPVLDLVNTGLIMKGEALELIPDFASLVRWFQAASLLGPDDAHRLERKWGHSMQGSQVAAAVRRLRDTLRQEILRWESGRSIRPEMFDILNGLLAEHPVRTRLRKAEGGPMRETYFAAQRPDDLLAPLADAAAGLFADTPADRVRKCASCVAHFYDNSKKGNRRWCSMQLCGNREKVAAYAARQRRAAHRTLRRALRAG